MRLHRIVLATVALTLAIAPLSARAAEAGPDYVASSPSDGEKRPTAPDEVWITFTMPLDQSSKLVVVDECERRVDNGEVLVVGNRISVGLEKKPSGKYEAHWQVRAPSGATGDGVGVLRFEVTAGDACGADPHAGHGGDKDGNKGGHKNHKGNDNNQHDGRDTGDGRTTSSGHQSSAGTHSSTGTPSSGSGHSVSGGSSHEASGGNGKNKKNAPAGNDEPGDSRDIAAPGIPDLPSVAGSDVLVALLLCMVLGAAGGYVVRVSRVL